MKAPFEKICLFLFSKHQRSKMQEFGWLYTACRSNPGKSGATKIIILQCKPSLVTRIIQWDPFWGDQTWCKCMVGLRDFPLIVPCLGWFHIIDPCSEPNVKPVFCGMTQAFWWVVSRIGYLLYAGGKCLVGKWNGSQFDEEIFGSDGWEKPFNANYKHPTTKLETATNGFGAGRIQGTIGCTPNSVAMVFIVFSRDSWGL